MTMSSVGEYKTIEDVISDLNVMILEAPIPTHIAMILANVVGELEDEGLFAELTNELKSQIFEITKRRFKKCF